MSPIRSASIPLVVLFAALIPPSAAAQQALPKQVIEDFHDTLLLVMKEADILGFEGRKDVLSPEVARNFDLRLMARIASGKAWKTMTAEQRDRLAAAFAGMTVSTYASRFDGYSGQRFEIVSETQTRRKGVLVRTNLVKSNGDKISLDYLLLNGGDRWRIVDIFLKRISELATRASEYTSVIRRKGVDALIDSLEKRIEAIQQEEN